MQYPTFRFGTDAPTITPATPPPATRQPLAADLPTPITLISLGAWLVCSMWTKLPAQYMACPTACLYVANIVVKYHEQVSFE